MHSGCSSANYNANVKKITNIPQSVAILAGFFSFLISACSPLNSPSSPAASMPGKTGKSYEFHHSHTEFNLILEKHVTNGWVDYRGILSESDMFYRYINSLGAVNAETLASWSRDQEFAYWINAYNAFTIQAIIEKYPIRSRSLIGLFFPQNSILQISGIWDRLKFNAGGQSLTLGQIEHEILRKLFDEPRIHFAIVCASRSCPALRSEAYRSDILEFQLHEQTVEFINDPARGVRWDSAKQRLYISKIFKWFKEDFKQKTDASETPNRAEVPGNRLLAFIRPYIRNEAIIDSMGDNWNVRVSYLPYDWRLNEQI
jgi:hypothetical protein